ncbi:Helix-turn-helix domain-containing protein [Streptomyces zhaozhouensis]|uniref:Helix-turn-helix domain-containing protein n=1 Tax=Streptomyces zhaozhouensis TaxID=1300267 RepID=A0A286DVI0_9ACTN|nr:helix-turn-helix domain-containing protein [Streptomyces zhaozhouensis]SOD62681.1 Helix-turn-helix domain-containing protein [Streptomyces zhaozhouensis]
MRETVVCLAEPPVVTSVGVGFHGPAGHVDVFRLPDLWQLHLYPYEADLTVDGTQHAIRPGRISLVPPATTVRYRYRSRCQHLFAHLRLPDVGERRTVPVMQDAGPELPLLSSHMHQAVAAWPGTPVRAAAEIWAVLWRVAHLAPPRSSPQGRGKAPHPAVDTAIAYIEARLAETLTVPAVAHAAGVSHNHLTRIFGAATGDTVVAYIRRRRIARARHLLRESTLSIPAIAAQVGIPDLQAFNKACRRELGASPRAVRHGSGERAP